MMPSLSLSGGAGGDSTNGDFGGSSASGGQSFGGGAGAGSRGIVINAGKAKKEKGGFAIPSWAAYAFFGLAAFLLWRKMRKGAL